MCILAASSWPTAFDFDFKFKPFVPLKHTSEDYLQLHSCTNEVLHMFLCEFPVPQRPGKFSRFLKHAVVGHVVL